MGHIRLCTGMVFGMEVQPTHATRWPVVMEVLWRWYGSLLWKFAMEVCYGSLLWKFVMEVQPTHATRWPVVMEVCYGGGMEVWYEVCYGNLLWKWYGSLLWKFVMEVCYGSLLWKWYGNLVWKCNPPMQHVKLHLHFRNPALNWKENYFWRYTLLKWNEKNFTNTMHAKWVGLARTMHVRCIQFTVFFCRDLIIYTVNI